MKEKPIPAKENVTNKNSCTLILFNDEVNTFEHVIESLVEICGHAPEQAEQCALIAHFKGSCSVKHGRFSPLNSMRMRLEGRKLTTEVKTT